MNTEMRLDRNGEEFSSKVSRMKCLAVEEVCNNAEFVKFNVAYGCGAFSSKSQLLATVQLHRIIKWLIKGDFLAIRVKWN
jgi:hypothetical protein